MFRHYRTQGFILKKTDRGEADRIFTIYTKDFGKLEILAKAERKIKSKLKGGLELFYLSEIEFIQGKTHKTLTDAILIENFPILRKDLERLPIAYRISEVLDNLIKGQEADEKIWNLLNEIFNKLNTRASESERRVKMKTKFSSTTRAIAKAKRTSFSSLSFADARLGEEETLVSSTNLKLEIENLKLEILYYYFLWNLLSISGYQPELYNCSLCQKKLLPEKLYFNLKEGGIICQSCFKKLKLVEEDKSSSSPLAAARIGKEIDSETVKILRIILEKNWPILSKLKIEAKYLEGLASISKNYLSLICEENLSLSS